jgi:hypothetical protein
MPILISLLLAGQSAPMATPYVAPPPIITRSVAPPPIARSNSLPPPVVTVNTAPPPALLPINAIGDLGPQPPTLLEIRVSGEDGLLWQGSLRVGPSASYAENRNESPPVPCPGRPAYDNTLRTSLSLNVSKYGRGDGPDQFTFAVSWSRPGDARNCAEAAMRSVQLQQSVTLPPGGEAVLRGDGGLAVQVRRR